MSAFFLPPISNCLIIEIIPVMNGISVLLKTIQRRIMGTQNKRLTWARFPSIVICALFGFNKICCFCDKNYTLLSSLFIVNMINEESLFKSRSILKEKQDLTMAAMFFFHQDKWGLVEGLKNIIFENFGPQCPISFRGNQTTTDDWRKVIAKPHMTFENIYTVH